MAKFLDQELVTEYALLHAQIEQLEKREKELRLEIIEGFEDGLKCPKRGPYLLKLTYQKRSTISWKDEFVKLAKEYMGKQWRKYRDSLVSNAPRQKIPVLLKPSANPDYHVRLKEAS